MMGDTGQPPTEGTGTSDQILQKSPTGSTSTTSAWALGAGPAGNSKKQRSFAEIIAEQKINRNILEITLTKIQTTDAEGKTHTRKNLTYDEIGSFLFEVLKVNPSDCLRFNFTSGRYDSREVMFKPEINISPYLGSYKYLDHEITCKKQRNSITKITFKNVPLNIPDEEIVNLCESYGKPVDYGVHYEKMQNSKNRGMVGSTRYMEVELFPGASLLNYYWMEGPLVGDTGARVTVLHPGQIPQCYNCLELATKGCPGRGNGKACAALGTPRTRMDQYMETVKTKHGYSSLKQKYYEQNPIPGGAGNFGIVEHDVTEDEEDVMPMNPIEQKDKQLAALQKALDDSRKEVQDINNLRESLVKSKSELRSVRRSSSMAKSKVDTARKAIEQRISTCISDSSAEVEEEIITLYSALLDEESFCMEGDNIVAEEDFLKMVKERIKDYPGKVEKLEVVKNRILEKIKQKKLNRQQFRDRRDSISSLCSNSSKRVSSEQVGSDMFRVKLEESLNNKQ